MNAGYPSQCYPQYVTLLAEKNNDSNISLRNTTSFFIK